MTQYLSQLNKGPSQCNWAVAKCVLHYLKGTKDVGLVYQRIPKLKEDDLGHASPWAFCDANYAEDPRDCPSTSGYAFMLAGGPIAWKSKKKPSVTLSTTEAEYYMLSIACQEAIWLKQLCQELQMNFNEPINVYMDNTGVVALSDNPVLHNQSKHIDIRWHFMWDIIWSKSICTSHIPGTQKEPTF